MSVKVGHVSRPGAPRAWAPGTRLPKKKKKEAFEDCGGGGGAGWGGIVIIFKLAY